MTSAQLRMIDLPWLPRPSGDFVPRLNSIKRNPGSDWGTGLRSLASEYLGVTRALALSRALRQLRTYKSSTALTHFRLGVVSNWTLDFLAPMLEATALRHGIELEVIAADFDQGVQEAVDVDSRINSSRPDAVLLAFDYRGLPFRDSGRQAWPLFSADSSLATVKAMRDGFRNHGGAVNLVQTLPAPQGLLFGSMDLGLSGTLRSAIAEFNGEVARDVLGSGDVLIDVDWLAQLVGLENWYDDRHWHLARIGFSQRVLPLYADFVCRSLAALRGKSRKCLVLDLDNTLWGGVVGDDGADGIAVHIGDPRGEAFRAMQAAAADLRNRGILLAVCSKNDEAIAREAFRRNPSMVLSEDDFAVFVANWDDKATNLERIARELKIGVDSLVLVDDNPVERALVRGAVPEVAVPEIGDNVAMYPTILAAAGYFESTAFTAEDLARPREYGAASQRARLEDNSRDLSEFLQSLQMKIEFGPFEPNNRKRTTQLINKTNQFNLTTRRYTESQVSEFEISPQHYTLQASLSDRFGDNGIISVVIASSHEHDWEIDMWLMSCRVLNRRVEEAVFNRLATDAASAGAHRLIGRFIATDRNSIVKDLYSRLGFSLCDDEQTGERWVLELASFQPFQVPIVG